jgi:chromosome partition protein MukF
VVTTATTDLAPNQWNVDRLLAGLRDRQVALQLETSDVIFLTLVIDHTDHGQEASLAEDDLYGIFHHAAEFLSEEAVNIQKRATHTIEKLRQQQLLARVDSASFLHTGEYVPTVLARQIVSFFAQDEELTKESLSVLTKATHAALVTLAGQAKVATTEEAWRPIENDLRVRIRLLIEGVERRQRGMDRHQEEIQNDIEQLLDAQWYEAVGNCLEILVQVATNLEELNGILMADTEQIESCLEDITQAARKQKRGEILAVTDLMLSHVERMRSWGSERCTNWSTYYRRMQGFIRDVVRLDPERALHQRVTELVRSYAQCPWQLLCAQEPKIRVLREQDQSRQQVVAERPKRDWSVIEAVEEERAKLPITAWVDEALAAGCRTLAAVIERVLPRVPAARQFAAVGQIADAVVARTTLAGGRRPTGPWVPIEDRLLIENLAIEEVRTDDV